MKYEAVVVPRKLSNSRLIQIKLAGQSAGQYAIKRPGFARTD